MQVTEPVTARAIRTSKRNLVVVLADREVRIPWTACSPRLAEADDAQRRQAELSPGGYGIHWPAIDEDLSVAGLLRDHKDERRASGVTARPAAKAKRRVTI